ncbi:HTH_48 domain-containing protein [Trichonephila clavipes]|nr:HTH_48 domain-containing protein [Trichonephila clavipes]
MNMNCYIGELAYIHFNYGPANGNGRFAVSLHGEGYSMKRQPNRQTFAWEHQNLTEHGSFNFMATIDDSPSNLKWIWWHEYPSLQLRSVKRLIFSNMSSNPCRIGDVRAYVPMAAISNTSCDVLRKRQQDGLKSAVTSIDGDYDRWKDIVRRILKDKFEYRAVIKSLFLKGNTPTQIKNELDSVYGDSAPSFTTVKVWAAEFKRSRKSLGDDERSGRPNTATTDEHIAKVHQIVLDDHRER